MIIGVKQVFEILMPIVDNVGESIEVRERAVKLLVSWGPDSSWWQRMAAMTWHEPNRQMASFVSSIIYTTSRLNHIAHGPQ